MHQLGRWALLEHSDRVIASQVQKIKASVHKACLEHPLLALRMQ